MWRDVLADAGVTVETVDARRVRLRDESGEHVLLLKRSSRVLPPSQIPTTPPETALLVVPRATRRAVDAATAAGWNVVSDAGQLALRLGGREYVSGARASAAPEPREVSPGPKPWTTLTVARRLLAGPPATQVVLAERVGATQSQVSRSLARLAGLGLVERRTMGWGPVDWNMLCDWWLENYPGPGGIESYWYSLDAPVEQVSKALTLLGDRAAVSGDVAADAIAPWRRPVDALVYVRAGVSLEAQGMVAVASAADATLTVTAPEDPGLWLPRPWTTADGTSIADPLQIVYDIIRGSGTDRNEAANHVREALRTTLRTRWQEAARGGNHA